MPTKTFWPAPLSHTPLAHEKKRESLASGGFVPVPVPVIRTVCGLAAALSATMNVAERVPEAVGAKVIETLQAAAGGERQAGAAVAHLSGAADRVIPRRPR